MVNCRIEAGAACCIDLTEIKAGTASLGHMVTMIATITIASVVLALSIGVAVFARFGEGARRQPSLVPIRSRSHVRRS